MNVIYNCAYPFSHQIDPRTFSFIVLIVLGIFSYIYLTSHLRSRFADMSFFVIVLGSISNLIQRFINGCVADYIDFFGLFVFNIADVMITAGIIVLVYNIIRK